MEARKAPEPVTMKVLAVLVVLAIARQAAAQARVFATDGCIEAAPGPVREACEILCKRAVDHKPRLIPGIWLSFPLGRFCGYREPQAAVGSLLMP